MINTEGVLTLLLDLLTKEEERVDDYTREHRFNIPLLVYRLFLLLFYQICVETILYSPVGKVSGKSLSSNDSI